MPNGHGGIPRFGSSVILLILLILVYAQQRQEGWRWLAYAGYPLVIAIGWRFAFHLHMWRAAEYGGAYTSEERWVKAGMKYWIGTAAYSAIGVLLWYVLIW